MIEDFRNLIRHGRALNAEGFWESAEKMRLEVRDLPYTIAVPREDAFVESVLHSAAESGVGQEALAWADRVASNVHIPAAKETIQSLVKSNPAFAMAIGITFSIPAAIRTAQHFNDWKRENAAREAETRSHSHQTLESPTGKRIKAQLDLPYQKHSKFDYDKVLKFFDVLEDRYPNLFAPLRSHIRLLYTLRENSLVTLTTYENSHVPSLAAVARLTSRSVLYAEHLERKLNIFRPYSPGAVLGRLVRSIGGVEEHPLAEIALDGLSARSMRIVKGLGLGLGLIESIATAQKAFHGISRFFHRRVVGPYEDGQQREEDATRRKQYKAWRKHKGLAVREGDEEDDGLWDQIKSEAGEFMSPHGLLSRAFDTFLHPSRHGATLTALAVGASVTGFQIAQRSEEIFPNGLKSVLKEGSHAMSEVLTDPMNHNIRNWSALGAAGLWTAFHAGNIATGLAGFGPLVATLTADLISSRVASAAFKHEFVQKGFAHLSEMLTERVDSYFQLEGKPLGIPIIGSKLQEIREGAVAIRHSIAMRSLVGAETKEILLAEKNAKLLGQELLGGPLEILLMPVATQLLKTIGGYLDKINQNRHAHARVLRQVAEDRAQDAQQNPQQTPSMMGSMSAHPKTQASPPPPSGAAPTIAVHTHVHHQDDPVDMRVLHTAHKKRSRRGHASAQYMGTYA